MLFSCSRADPAESPYYIGNVLGVNPLILRDKVSDRSFVILFSFPYI